MGKLRLTSVAALVGVTAATVNVASAQDVLTGDTRLACEAILCLSSGQRPDECDPALDRYFGIRKRNLSDTIRARRNFLKLCPAASYDSNMNSLVDAIADGAGRCDADTLNSVLLREVEVQRCPPLGSWEYANEGCYIEFVYVIDNVAPEYCAAYDNHEYTWQVGGAQYVGTPTEGGRWIDVAPEPVAVVIPEIPETAEYEETPPPEEVFDPEVSGGGGSVGCFGCTQNPAPEPAPEPRNWEVWSQPVFDTYQVIYESCMAATVIDMAACTAALPPFEAAIESYVFERATLLDGGDCGTECEAARQAFRDEFPTYTAAWERAINDFHQQGLTNLNATPEQWIELSNAWFGLMQPWDRIETALHDKFYRP